MARGGVRRLLFTCGNGECGQLGNGSMVGTSLFTAVQGLMGSDVVAAACGNAHTAAVSACGTLSTFGSNSHRQLGHSHEVAMVTVPHVVDLPDACQSVACGAAFTLALTKSGELWGACPLKYSVEGPQLHDSGTILFSQHAEAAHCDGHGLLPLAVAVGVASGIANHLYWCRTSVSNRGAHLQAWCKKDSPRTFMWLMPT
jgi:hypothetical protein